jgi:hypothetical protein
MPKGTGYGKGLTRLARAKRKVRMAATGKLKKEEHSPAGRKHLTKRAADKLVAEYEKKKAKSKAQPKAQPKTKAKAKAKVKAKAKAKVKYAITAKERLKQAGITGQELARFRKK